MSIDRQEIARIAHLARLEVSEQAASRTAEELARILDFVGRMDAVDTSGVTPMAHPLDAVQPLREDRVTEEDRRGAFQACAPAVEDGLYLVPRVVE
ncbi:MAG: Asp-tRNA(Asn)/Glu-tRNA(Gln) amidotransferase subunit GatC [Gammaproteobacteria bacterium]|nr:Asp-tRNA(Asn)/Glu-tRNA(Gln) amidotransferase subunit GatC [Gammaproteobacteria bacterium]NIM73680.1 Asp-tRNA(Asn)/Glu-tRNA(Gln) amidotransferase subunit GatC [Gammaproteobacteria bacterium]NIN37354.1 Asp-tRNA(Asn)/Glu-tRNA(Gln) amidotransferase subunit GatC [Gammaproteobacteria bacterium]NIO25513.1 Asp-tRNA(Asn)/Glu-tRNA(Gln) amidotransferase subunit GatC [Gammaproteobacteria bacterium]NIO66188.1 Asp-tRNA(Asn)/Glu-tRNA(Gln) amidotransferase subunit GatC [Gammaproteobacteria bacterium]